MANSDNNLLKNKRGTDFSPDKLRRSALILNWIKETKSLKSNQDLADFLGLSYQKIYGVLYSDYAQPLSEKSIAVIRLKFPEISPSFVMFGGEMFTTSKNVA